MPRANVVMAVLIGVLVAGFSYNVPAQGQKRNEPASIESLEGMRYPPLARTANVEGRIVVQATLDDNGNVVSASATPSDKKTMGILIPDVLSNARKWVFRPNSSKEAAIVYEFQLRECTQHQSDWRFTYKSPNVVVISDCGVPLEP